MTKSDDKGEPVKTVTIGGKKVEVPIIFVLPEEAGEKEIERYEHPKVHIESKKIAPLLGAGGIGGAASGIAGGVASAGKKIGEDIKDTAEQAPQAIGEGAKLSESLSADSEEEPLDKLTHGKLEEVEKLPYKDQLQGTVMDETRAVESGKVRPPHSKHLIDPKWKGYSDDFKEGGFKQQEAPKEEEETTPYFDLLSDKPKKKKKKKKEDVSYRALFDKGYGKAQALRRSVEEQKKRGAKTDDELAEESKKKIPKGQKGMLNYNYLFDKPDIEEKDYLTDEEGDEIEKSWERWLKQKDAQDPKARKDEGRSGSSTYSEGGRTSSGKLKPSKTTRTGYGGLWFGGSPYSYDSTEQVGGGQSHGKQSKQVREEGTEYRGLEEPRQSQSVMPHEQDYNRQNRTELKHPEKFETSHLPMDRHIMSKKPAKGERSMDKLDEKGKPKHENIYSEPDRRYQSDWDEDASKRGTGDSARYSDTGTPKDEMTRTETIIHDKMPKTGEAPKGTWRGRAHRTDEQEEAKKKQQEKREKKRKLQQKLDVLSQNSKQSNKKKAWEKWLQKRDPPKKPDWGDEHEYNLWREQGHTKEPRKKPLKDLSEQADIAPPDNPDQINYQDSKKIPPSRVIGSQGVKDQNSTSESGEKESRKLLGRKWKDPYKDPRVRLSREFLGEEGARGAADALMEQQDQQDVHQVNRPQITQENAEKWKSWLEKRQTKIDRKQEWGDKSKIGIGSWEDRPELKPKGRKDKKGKRIRERGQGEGNLREGAL